MYDLPRLRLLSFFGALFLWVGCTQADGEPCDIDRDCGESSYCCGRSLPDNRGVCTPEGESCRTSMPDAGVVDAAIDDAGILADAGEGEDAGTDPDGGADDAGVDAGSGDAGAADAGVDAGTDAGGDAGPDAGPDAGAAALP